MKNTPVVVAFKLELVKQFYQMRQALAAPRFSIPQTYAAALELAALQAREIESLEAQAVQDAPKVLFADSVATSSTTILVGDLAKILKGNGVEVGANRLFEWLRRVGFLIRRQGADWNSP
ncbi:MAG: phage regulatory protein/antirepressor Ant, partial [Leucobacter sp.]|nr:phage regulatory protein/antirepressor Ant [Leucobacter sp.]